MKKEHSFIHNSIKNSSHLGIYVTKDIVESITVKRHSRRPKSREKYHEMKKKVQCCEDVNSPLIDLQIRCHFNKKLSRVLRGT